MSSIFSKDLAQGTISVKSRLHNSSRSMEELFDFAQRRNPKRPFLFVSKVLGRHIPAKPSVMRAVYSELAAGIPDGLPQPIVVIGMAETAVGLGAGVFQEMSRRFPDAVYLTSTRHPVEGELLCEFKEEHSHATDHLIYLPTSNDHRRLVQTARTLVLVDDEATTGNTFRNLSMALRNSGHLPGIEQVVAVTLTDWSGNALQSTIDLPVTSVSLVAGKWEWMADPASGPIEMPPVNVTAAGTSTVSSKQTWGRLGMTSPNDGLAKDTRTTNGERILVVGTGEFVYEPFLLAERLEAAGADVHFSSTSRSPISLGHAIDSAISFSDNYGLGIPNFLYNVGHLKFDRILLCSETGKESIDPALIDALQNSAKVLETVTHE